MKAAFFLIAALAIIVVAKAYPHDDEETNAVYESLANEDEGSSLTQSAYADTDSDSSSSGEGKKGGKGGKGGKGKGGKGGKGKGGKGKGKGGSTTPAPSA